MLFDKGFVPLGELKDRLGISDSDDDILLNEILRSTAGMIEGIAGRMLRRDHGRTEILSGGSRTIRVAVSPIAKIHQVRESADRDFEDLTKYTALVEGTDFVMEAGDGGGRPGDSQVLRRIGANWKGNELNGSGQIRVVYTGGYKTDDEVDLENDTLTIQSPTEISDFEVTQRAASGNNYYTIDGGSDVDVTAIETVDIVSKLVVRFDLKDKLFPLWGLNSVDLTYSLSHVSGTGDGEGNVYLPSVDPLFVSPESLWKDLSSTGGATLQAALTVLQTVPTGYGFSASSNLLQDAFVAQVLDRFIAFAIEPRDTEATDENIVCESVESVTVSERPKLVVVHRRGDDSSFSVPGDLRHANLLQAVHEFQTRRQPGVIALSQRGVTIASGSSFLKTLAQALPAVAQIASSYRRMY